MTLLSIVRRGSYMSDFFDDMSCSIVTRVILLCSLSDNIFVFLLTFQ